MTASTQVHVGVKGGTIAVEVLLFLTAIVAIVSMVAAGFLCFIMKKNKARNRRRHGYSVLYVLGETIVHHLQAASLKHNNAPSI